MDWLEVRELAGRWGRKGSVKGAALYLWLTPENGVIPTTKKGGPSGWPLRHIAEKLAERGITNGKGAPYHPYQLQDIIFDGLAKTTYFVLKRQEMTSTKNVRLTLEELRKSLKDICRQRVCEGETEEELIRKLWFRFQKRKKRRLDGEDLEGFQIL